MLNSVLSDTLTCIKMRQEATILIRKWRTCTAEYATWDTEGILMYQFLQAHKHIPLHVLLKALTLL
jgi:hypothetical protein